MIRMQICCQFIVAVSRNKLTGILEMTVNERIANCFATILTKHSQSFYFSIFIP
jgi:hypothetical protein